MRVEVEELNSGSTRGFEGEPDQLAGQLLAAYPWLAAGDASDQDLDQLVEHLDSTGGYTVDVQGAPAPAPGRPEVALVMAYDASGRLLLGRRNDTGRWTLAGGHLNPGEPPEDGARRELWQETGFVPFSLSPLPGLRARAGGPVLHVYTALVGGLPHGHLDPDREVASWSFHDVSEGLPAEVDAMLHGPAGPDNVVRQMYPVQESSPAQERGVEKAEGPRGAGGAPTSPPVAGDRYHGLAPSQPDHRSRAAMDKMHPLAGKSVDGMWVRDSVPNTDSIDATLGGTDYSVLRGIREVPMSYIGDTDPKSRYYSADSHDHALGLAAQIRENEEINPLIVVHDAEGHYVLEGNHRIGALHALGKKSFPAMVVVHHDSFESPSVAKAEGGLHEHHDPRERTLHAMTQSLHGHRLLRACLDPHPDVRHAALRRPEVDGDVLLQLAAARRMADGSRPGLAVVDFLQHPLAERRHAEMAARAAAAGGDEDALAVAREALERPLGKAEASLEKSDWHHEELPGGYRLSGGYDQGGYTVDVSDAHHNTVGQATFTPQRHFHTDAFGDPVLESQEPDEYGHVTHSQKVTTSHWKPWMVKVHPQHTRKGIATAMYRHVEARTGIPILGGSVQSSEGQAFRAAYDAGKAKP